IYVSRFQRSVLDGVLSLGLRPRLVCRRAFGPRSGATNFGPTAPESVCITPSGIKFCLLLLSSRPEHRGFLRCVVERSLHSVVAAIVSTKKNAAISPLPLRLATLRQGPVKMTPQKITKACTEVLADC